VTLLNTAKALAAVRGQLKRSVVLMWFSGEEEGLLGSKHWVANPWIPVSKTVYMINIDMVGYLRQNGQKLLALGGGTSKPGQKIIESAAAKYPDIKLTVTDRAGGGSDHVPFMNAGVPGVFFNTGVSSNPNYHKTSDHPDLIDYEGMFSISRIVFETAFEVSRAPTTKAGDFDSGFHAGDYRPSLVTPEELDQTCHHLMRNPFMQ
jgi:Zn-dependent M28 family amino/carboxypeptidase